MNKLPGILRYTFRHTARVVGDAFLRLQGAPSKEELRKAEKAALKRQRKKDEKRKRLRLAAKAPSILPMVLIPPINLTEEKSKTEPPQLVVEPQAMVPVIGRLPTRTSLLEEHEAAPKLASKSYRSLAKIYGQIIAETTAINARHSLTPGRWDWAEKWQSCEGKRVLFFANSDYSGSFYKWAEAVNRNTKHAVRLVCMQRHRYGYPLDILYPYGSVLTSRFPEILDDFLALVDESDIVHVKDQTGFFNGRNKLPATLLGQFRKPVVYTLYGGTARQDEADVSFQRHVKSHAAVIAMTPDLCFDWADAHFIPHTIDEERHPYSWDDGKLILHTPSSPFRKGTDIFRSAAARIVAQIGARLEIITGTNHDYIMMQKPKATIFFDQAGRETEENGGKLIGWYGNSALEAAVFGVPTMAHLSQEAIERAERAGYNATVENAVLNVEPTERSLYETMHSFFERFPREREEIALSTRQWIERHHSYTATSRRLSDIYNSL